METITDYDLDVMNALKDFPVNETEGYIFLRGCYDKDAQEPITCFTNTKSSPTTLQALFYSFGSRDEDAKRILFNATLNVINESDNTEMEALAMIDHLNGIINSVKKKKR